MGAHGGGGGVFIPTFWSGMVCTITPHLMINKTSDDIYGKNLRYWDICSIPNDILLKSQIALNDNSTVVLFGVRWVRMRCIFWILMIIFNSIFHNKSSHNKGSIRRYFQNQPPLFKRVCATGIVCT